MCVTYDEHGAQEREVAGACRSGTVTPPATKEKKEADPGYESSDMGKVGDASLCRFSAVDPVGADELEHDPVPDDQIGRDLDKGEENKDRQKGKDPGMGVEYQVGSHHPGYCAAGADHGDARLGGAEGLGNGSGQAAGKIKDDEPELAENILDIVAKDPEKEHVRADVEPVAVEKHRREYLVPGTPRFGD